MSHNDITAVISEQLFRSIVDLALVTISHMVTTKRPWTPDPAKAEAYSVAVDAYSQAIYQLPICASAKLILSDVAFQQASIVYLTRQLTRHSVQIEGLTCGTIPPEVRKKLDAMVDEPKN